MKLSVLMITYNHERFISQALDSILAQQVNFDYEIVVGEDNSSDGTAAILAGYRERFPDRIRVISSGSNVGMHENFIRTYRACRGEYIAILEGDDYWTFPRKLQAQVDFLEENPDYVTCFSAVDIFNQASGKVVETVRSASRDASYTVDDLLHDNIIQTCSSVFRNGLIKEFPRWLFSLKMMDWPVHILNARHGSLKYLNHVMAAYRIHPSGVWGHVSAETRLQSVIDTFQILIDNLDPSFTASLTEGMNGYRFRLLNEYLNCGNVRAARPLLKELEESHPRLVQSQAVLWKIRLAWLLKITHRWYRSMPAAKRLVKACRRAAASL